MQLFLIGIGIFIVTVIIIELLIYAASNTRSAKRANFRKRLRNYTYSDAGEVGADILKKRIYSDIPVVNSLLSSIPGVSKIDNLVAQANAKHPMGFYVFFVMLLAALGYAVGELFLSEVYQSLLLMLVSGSLPFVHLKRLKRKRVEKFKKQLPDGLDLVARALKAGHAFSGGMKLAADEFEDPLGPEFFETLNEINFGISVPNALKNLAGRIDCEELGYFVVGVILQRETGGRINRNAGQPHPCKI